MTLELMIATIYPAGIKRVAAMNLPEMDGVRYLVSWQQPRGEPVPEELASRNDVRIIAHDSVGVARNRNVALREATGDILLLSDDDLKYTPRNFADIIEIFRNNPDVDLATFKFSGADKKTYPRKETDLSLPLPCKGWYISEIEVAFRRESVQGKIEFNERFGIGAGYIASGEIDTLIIQAIRHLGLRGRFFPIEIAVHPPHFTTGERGNQSPGVLRAKGVFRYLYYPKSWWARIPFDAWRDKKNGRASFFKSLAALIQGAAYGIRYMNMDGTPRIRQNKNKSNC